MLLIHKLHSCNAIQSLSLSLHGIHLLYVCVCPFVWDIRKHIKFDNNKWIRKFSMIHQEQQQQQQFWNVAIQKLIQNSMKKTHYRIIFN